MNNIMKHEWTDEEKKAIYGKPIDLSWYDSRPQQQQQEDILMESMRLKAIGVALFDGDGFRGNEDEPEIKTKYFKTYADYFMAQEKVRRQIEFKHEPVDLELEQKLIAETKNIRQQRVEFYRNKKRDHK